MSAALATAEPPLPMPDSEAARVRLAARPGTPEAMLRRLAEDPAVTVRAAVAMNPAYVPSVHARLLEDGDERVRSLLAGKVAGLLPQLSDRDRRDAQAHAHEVLLTLASDAAVRVRTTLGQVLRSMPEAPHAVIMRLAQDEAVSVSEPVLRLSPLLTDADLLELLASPPHPMAAQAVAGRAGVSAAVSDAVARTADGAAIRTLLTNQSAVVRESTLDALIGQAGDHPDWHEPLVQRPSLPERAARALSLIVAGHLLDTLSRRADLPSSLVEEIRVRLSATPPPDDDAQMMGQLQRQHQSKPLDEAALHEAAGCGDARRVAAILAITGGVTLERVDRAVALRNAKGLVSLAWRAGFSMGAAQVIQSVLGPFGPGEALGPAPHGAFPLSVNEMEWQIELLAEPGA